MSPIAIAYALTATAGTLGALVTIGALWTAAVRDAVREIRVEVARHRAGGRS